MKSQFNNKNNSQKRISQIDFQATADFTNPQINNKDDLSFASCLKNQSYMQDASKYQENTDRFIFENNDRSSERQDDIFQNQLQNKKQNLSPTASATQQEYSSDVSKSDNHSSSSTKKQQTTGDPMQNQDQLQNDEQSQKNENVDSSDKSEVQSAFSEMKVDGEIDDDEDSQKQKQNQIRPKEPSACKKSILVEDTSKQKDVKLRVVRRNLESYVMKVKYARLIAKAFKQSFFTPDKTLEVSKDMNFLKPSITQVEREINKQSIFQPYSGNNNLVDNFERGILIVQQMLFSAKSKQAVTQGHINKFLLKLMRLSKIRRLENLQEVEFNLLGDSSHLASRQNKHSVYIFRFLIFVYKNIRDYFEQINQQIPVFLPSSNFKLFWDFFQIFYTVIFFFFYSIFAFFAQNSLILPQDQPITSGYNGVQSILKMTTIFFSIDMMVSFNTAFYNKDQIVKIRKIIAKKYLRSHFIFDLLSTLVLILKITVIDRSFHFSQGYAYIIAYIENFIVLSRIFSLKSKRKNLESSINLNQTQKYILKLIDLIFLAISFAHTGMKINIVQTLIKFISLTLFQIVLLFILNTIQMLIQLLQKHLKIVCILWNELAQFEDYFEFEITWRVKAQIPTEHWYAKYIYSLYWAVTTMSTVGYGDITPSNYIESFFVTLNMLLMSCVFAYIINNVGMILQEIDKSSKELNQDIDTIQRYLNRKNVNVTLKSRVRHYLNFVAEEQQDIYKEQEDKVFLKLSKKLRDEITIEINEKILNRYSIFHKYFSKQTLNRVILSLQEILIQPNDLIFTERVLDDQSIYFLHSGLIEIFIQQSPNSNEIVLKQLSQNELFGEISFFSGKVRQASARSLNLSTLYRIKRSDFIFILSQNSEDLERFKMLENQMNCLNNISCIGLECYLCKEQGHYASQCRRTHYVPDKQFQNLRNEFSFFQEREKDKRLTQKNPSHKAKDLIEQNKNVKQVMTIRMKDFEEYAEQYLEQYSEEDEEDSQNEDYENEEYEDEEDDVTISKNQDQQQFKSNSSLTSLKKRKQSTLINDNNALSPEKGKRGTIQIKLNKPHSTNNKNEEGFIISSYDLTAIEESKQKEEQTYIENSLSQDEIRNSQTKIIQKYDYSSDGLLENGFKPRLTNETQQQNKGENNSILQLDEDTEINNSSPIKQSQNSNNSNSTKKEFDYTVQIDNKKISKEDKRRFMTAHKSKSIDKKQKSRNSSIFSLKNQMSLDQQNQSITALFPSNNQGGHAIPRLSLNGIQPQLNLQLNLGKRDSLQVNNNIGIQFRRPSSGQILTPSQILDKKNKGNNYYHNLNSSHSSHKSYMQAIPQQNYHDLDTQSLNQTLQHLIKNALNNIQIQQQNENSPHTLSHLMKDDKLNMNASRYSIRGDDILTNAGADPILAYFDKMCDFKIFLTHNNPGKVILEYRNKIYLNNRHKKMKSRGPIQKKERRGQIILEHDRFLKNFKTGLIKSTTCLEEKQNTYRPTYLSYGVALQNGPLYPLNFFYKTDLKQKYQLRQSFFQN